MYFIFAVPGASPVTTPVPDTTVATEVFRLDQVPDGVASVSVVVDPSQTLSVPPIEAGRLFTVIFITEEISSEHEPFFTMALNQVSAVSYHIVVPVSVADVTLIVVTDENEISVDFSQRWMVPVYEATVRSAGVSPEQIAWAELTVPPTDNASTVTISVSVS